MLFQPALDGLLRATLAEPGHQLLTAIKVPQIEPSMIFVTKNGQVYKGTHRSLKEQFSMTIRHEVWTKYQTIRPQISDEPELGWTISSQKIYFDDNVMFKSAMCETLMTWYRAYSRV